MKGPLNGISLCFGQFVTHYCWGREKKLWYLFASTLFVLIVALVALEVQFDSQEKHIEIKECLKQTCRKPINYWFLECWLDLHCRGRMAALTLRYVCNMKRWEWLWVLDSQQILYYDFMEIKNLFRKVHNWKVIFQKLNAAYVIVVVVN